MQKIILSLLLLVAGFNLNAQNVVHDANAQARSVGAFTKIDIGSAINLYLSQGNAQGVAVSSEDPAITARIRTEVKNGTLKIYVEKGAWNGWNWSNKHLKAYVTFTTLEALGVSGACNVELTDPINVGDLKLELSGASNLNGTIKGNNIAIELSGASNINKANFTANSIAFSQTGASDVKATINTTKASFDMSGSSDADITGSTSNLTIDASGASDFKGNDFAAVTCKVGTSGGSSANINVSKELQASATGGSDIRYSGAANITSLDVSGGSTVKKKS